MAGQRVYLSQCESYEHDVLHPIIEQAFAAFGMPERIMPGMRVLVKPNLLMGFPVERAVTTHPAVVESVVRLLLDCGASVTIGDSPGMGTAAKAAAKGGITAVAEKLGVEVVEFDESVEVPLAGNGLFRKIEIARTVLDADAVVNLAKFKSHGQMTLTLAVKNLFGCVVGHRKAQWHMAAGRDRDAFAQLLLELWRCIAPCFSIIDGITGMDGNGPSGGRARKLGVLLAGDNALAVDSVAAQLAGVPEERFPLLKVARQIPEFSDYVEDIEVLGDSVDDLKIPDFDLPAAVDLFFGPRFLHRVFRRAMTARPKINAGKCKACGMCVESCPPHAMKLENERVTIDYNQCISCFCCQEMCPQKAIDVSRGWLSKLIIHRKS